jgi:ATP-binding cassette subfamily B protein
LPGILSAAGGLVVAAGAMAVLSPVLTVVALALAPLVLWVARRLGHVLKSLSDSGQRIRADLSSLVAERLSLGGVTLARVHGRREHEGERFTEESERLALLQVRSSMITEWVLSAGHVFFALTPYLVFVAAGVADGVSPGTLAAFTVLQARLYHPLWQILHISTDLRSAQGAFDRVFDYLDLQQEQVLRQQAVARAGNAGGFTARGMGFCYSAEGESHPAVREVDLEIPAASTTLIVGPSGSGKSTLGYLLAGLHLPTEGSISFAGTQISGPMPDRVCIAMQEPFLFQGTIADNLRYAAPEATMRDLVRACETTQIHDRIAALADGYDSLVGERGMLFSGGERQRLALARAILADTPALVLDEATSALDPIAEAKVVRAVLAQREGRTTIMITHRFGLLETFDTVLVLDAGRVVEHGARADLLGKRTGLYTRMVHAQIGR